MINDSKFHRFEDNEIKGIKLPELFTYPFHYEPHILSRIAAKHLNDYLSSRHDWHEELKQGKMMGVLVVQHRNTIGFLAAFSGILAHSNNHSYFVPAVYDLLLPDGFFIAEEKNISAINLLIDNELQSQHRQEIINNITIAKTSAQKEIENYRKTMKASKIKRDEARLNGLEQASLIAESQFQKAELKRIKTRWKQSIEELQKHIDQSDIKISQWKEERRKRSATLQERIFRNFVMLNAMGQKQDLCEIFASTPQKFPPAGAGECAAPKLLQYAYSHGYKPIVMAEFWVGESPKDEIRRHGCFYPSCVAKCKPILEWMLQGVDVEPNPLESTSGHNNIDIIYEDNWILAVNKLDGILSVPGKLSVDSLQEQMVRLFPSSTPPIIVHRLDMATSGVLLFAKSQNVYKLLQSMFKNQQIKKHYIAILNGITTPDKGIINLPLTPNINDRPRQMVSHTHGKCAITRYEVIKRTQNTTRINFYPETGRTHQLRVHASHPLGLNSPILGDNLYGHNFTATSTDSVTTKIPYKRLYLHAYSIEFIHPITQQYISITAPCPF